MVVVLVDGNNVAWQAFYALPELSYDRRRTEVGFGFMLRVLKYAQQFKTSEFAFFWDSNSRLRRELFSGYKNRGVEDDPQKKIAREQIKRLRGEIIPALGFVNNFYLDGFEADDLIAYVTKKYRKQSYVIVSNDSDLLQLLDANVEIFSPSSRKVIDVPWLFDNHRVTMSQWVMVKAIAGCISDTVPGIERVGEKTAIKYIRGEKLGQAVLKKIEDGKDIVERNLKLVKLPFGGVKRREYRSVKLKEQASLMERDFIRVFERYRFISFLKKDEMEKWRGAFNLVGERKKRRVYRALRGQGDE